MFFFSIYTQPKKVDLGNICCLNNFLGGIDEEWFRLVHVAVEAKAAPAVAAMLRYAESRSVCAAGW